MELFTRKEAAAFLKIGLRTLDRRLEDGSLQCFRLGSGPKAAVRISKEQLNAFLFDVPESSTDEYSERAKEILER